VMSTLLALRLWQQRIDAVGERGKRWLDVHRRIVASGARFRRRSIGESLERAAIDGVESSTHRRMYQPYLSFRQGIFMKIGIIGAGQIGGTLARRFTELGHQVFIANSRGPASLSDVVAKTGATAVTAHEAARAGEVVVVTIQQSRIPELPNDLFADVPHDVAVIDTGNYYPRERDGRIEGIEAGLIESRWVEQQLGRPVIKAFNNIYAKSLGDKGTPPGAAARVALPVAGDEAAAKAAVLKLVEELGFDAVDAGGLDESWRQQPGTPVYCKDYDAAGVRKALSEASRQRTAQWSGTDNSPGTFESPA
jgi:predicted dinucleotide-binding enzyme